MTVQISDGGKLNVRAQPSTHAAWLAALSSGTRVHVEEYIADGGGWLRIAHQGQPAYILAEYTSYGQQPAPTVGGPREQQPPALGTLSEKYESSGDPGAISTGEGDSGGVSYGAYQLTTENAATYVKQCPWSARFAGLASGTREFSRVWKQIAAEASEVFKADQHAYIQRLYFDPIVANVQASLGVDARTRSNALQQVLWSVSVQHAPETSLISNALGGRSLDKLDDAQAIQLIYKQRSKRRPDGQLAYFTESSRSVQEGGAAIRR